MTDPQTTIAQGNRLRRIAAIGGSVVLVAWAAVSFRSFQSQGRWLDTQQSGALLALGEPATVDQKLRLARVYLEDIFPTDTEGAAELSTEGISRAPQRADAWLIYARAILFSGRREEARTALETSDRLDPMYGRQRLRAVQLWVLLGEDERAWSLARKVLASGAESKEIVLHLLRIGFRADEIVGALIDETTPPDITRAVLLALPPDVPLDPLEDSVPAAVWMDEEMAEALVPRLVRNRDVALLRRVLRESPGTPVIAPNLDLTVRPFSTSPSIGWREPSDKSPVLVNWRGSDEAATTPTLVIDFVQDGSSEVKLNWPMYLLLSEVTSAVRVEVRVTSPPEAPHSLWLTALAGGGRFRSEALQGGEAGVLSLAVPPAAGPQPITLILEGRISPSPGHSPTLEIAAPSITTDVSDE